MNDLYEKIEKIAKKESGNNLHTINDLFYLCKNTINDGNVSKGLDYCKKFKKLIDRLMNNETNIHKKELYDKIFDILVLETPYSLDSYFQALEWDRPLKAKFYLPRRNTLMKHGVIQALEDLLIHDNLDELFLSMPPRIGKTTLCVFAISWLLGVEPDSTNLYSSNSGTLTQTFYAGVHTILNDEYTYAWHKIFPNVKFNARNMCSAKDTWLDTGKSKRYHSFTARSIDGSLNGACDCDRLLIADDLVSGIEEALNLNRLKSLWNKTTSDLLSRAKQRAKILWIGTRWSIYDPIGNRLESGELKFKRSRNIVIPALDENDNSNFDYLCGVGFDSGFYRGKRLTYEDSEDIASWNAIYQGKPIEREGMLFNESTLRTYHGLPEIEPTRKFAFTDVGWGGGDFTSMPILYQFGVDLYCVGWIFDSGDKKITQPRVANAILNHLLTSVRFEKNNGGEGYRDDIAKLLDEKGYKCNLTCALASNQITKETKIFEHAPDIRAIYFLAPELRDNDYRRAMENLCAYTIRGKNKHDDAPDSLAGACDMANEIIKKVGFEIMQRLF